MPNKCFYHSSDLDGFCSAAIIGLFYKYENIEFKPINYGEEFPWDEISEQDKVYMVDFCLEPFDQMIKLADSCDLTWIDHHNSAIKEELEHPEFDVKGLRNKNFAACQLVWKYLFPKTNIPLVVNFLGYYDIWQWQNIRDCLELQMGMRMESKLNMNRFHEDDEIRILWELILKDSSIGRQLVSNYIESGKTVLKYQTYQNEQAAKSSAFEFEFEGTKFIAANVGGTGSQYFDSIIDNFPEARGLLTFQYRKGQVFVSLYHIEGRECPDMSEIAKLHGGGGHIAAAGFNTSAEKFFFLLSDYKEKQTWNQLSSIEKIVTH